jgi:ferritin-like metal-binding protein YciE
MDSLHELYVEELKDLYSAENMIIKALPRMIKAASSRELQRALTQHEKITRRQVQRLERIFRMLDESPRGKKCHGMEGLLEEGKELIADKPEPDVLNAGLISKAQHVEHYEIAGYGTVRTWAQTLGYAEHVDLLQQTLDEEKEADRLLTQLAESSVNIEAADETDSEADREVPMMAASEASSRGGRRSASGSRRGSRQTEAR